MAGTPRPTTVTTKCHRIATLARQAPELSFTTLAHHMDIDWMREAYRRTRKSGALGVDGQTAAMYAADLEKNLQSLLDRAKSGTYRAPPVRRTYIPKGVNQKRPIGVPTFEDKVLQRAVAMILEAVYEQDFLDCSYGFRPGRSAHQALQALWRETMDMGGCWLLEVDIQKFFDTLDHSHLRAFLRRRVRDGVLQRLMGKWLKAGVLEDGSVWYPEDGSPQGGVISPMFSNVYLHDVLDAWFERDVKPRLRGRSFLIRFADDFVMGFSSEADARRVLDVLPKRFGRYGLTLHPTKTRLVRFVRPPRQAEAKGDGRPPKPPTFDLLGFTHYWGRSRKGNWVVKRKTSASRLRRGLHRVAHWCRRHRHDRVREQHQVLVQKLRGHYGYYGITGNYGALLRFYAGAKKTWRKWLSRRSQCAYLSWPAFVRLLRRYPLPQPVVVHSAYRSAARS